MTPERILAAPARVLPQWAREAYFGKGFVLVEDAVGPDWIARLTAVTEGLVGASRHADASDNRFDLAPEHTPERPRVRRIKRPDEQHEAYWEFVCDMLADIAADLVGPDVVFHHSKLNFKWFDGGDEVKWHQDIQFYPHTNYSHLTIGTYLADTGSEHGPMSMLPGSHDGPLYDLRDGRGLWTGHLGDGDAAALPTEAAETLTCRAGAVSIHNCRTLHYSRPSRTDGGRPLLLNSFAAADALPYTAHPDPSRHSGALVRGKPARMARHDPRPCPLPPDWSGGYTSIFAAQAGEG